jgi:hypothetical protein
MQLLISGEGKKAQNRIKKLEKQIGGSTKLMAEVGALIIARNKATFGKGVQLQPETVEYKEKYGQSTEPLVETGRTKDELTTERGIKRLRPDELVFGSDSKVERGGDEIPLSKAYLLQHGSKHQKPRRVLKVTPVTRRKIGETILKGVTKD